MKYKSTVGVELIQSMGGDYMVCAAAKVSTNGSEAKALVDEEANAGLINYLVKHRHGCYDSETEVLTSKGWLKWPEVNGSEKFITLNLETDNIEIQNATNLVQKRINGPMIKIQTNSVDMLVTPDHNMVSYPRKIDKTWELGLHPAKDFLNRCHRIRLGGGNWTGQNIDTNEMEVLGFIVADGYAKTGVVSFHIKKDRKIKWLKERHEVNSNKNNTYLLADMSERLKELSRKTYTSNGDRCFPREILESGDSNSIKSMLFGYLAGDGHVHENGRITCSTVSQQLVNDIQEAALKSGLVAIQTSTDFTRIGAFGTRPLFKISIYHESNTCPKVGWTTTDRKKQVSVVEYSGDIYCVTVPNGTLYVRRNGKVAWCGNTPFEHSALTFYVHAPIFVWREWHRHRIGFSYNEESGRYKTLDPVFYIPDRERPMMKVDGWKPGRPKFLRCEDDAVFKKLVDNLKKSYELSYKMYEENLALGIDPGLARDCLPVGIYSGCWVTCNPRSLMSFISLRTHEPTATAVSYPLWEIELAARTCEQILKEGWPITYEAFCKNGRVAP